MLATTSLLGTYLAALRPHPTYAVPPSTGTAQQPELSARFASSATPPVVPTCAQADVTVSNETGLREQILNSRDDSVICIEGVITLSDALPLIDDTTVTFVGDDSTQDGIDGGGSFHLLRADFRGTGSGADDTLTISNLSLTNGSDISSDGAILVYSDDSIINSLVITESLFSNNEFDDGGAVSAKNSNVHIWNSTFADNDGNGDGGAAFFRDSNAEIWNSTFTSNEANEKGGALYVEDSRVAIWNSTFTSNKADYYYDTYGGAIDLYRSTAQIRYSEFTANTADSEDDGSVGGAISVRESLAHIWDSTFSSNEAGDYGGALFVNESPVHIRDSTFTGNVAAGGGAIRVEDSSLKDSLLQVWDSAFTGNTARDGGAMYQSNDTSVSLNRTTFVGNSARSEGAVLYARGGSSLTASTVSAFDNGGYDTGAFHFNGSDGYFTNSFIGSNSGGDLNAPGAIYARANSVVNLAFTTVYDNTGGGSSGIDVRLQENSILRATASVVGNSRDDTAISSDGTGMVDDTFSVSTSPGVAFGGTRSRQVAGGSLLLGVLDDTATPGYGGRTPGLGSVLVTGAPTSDLGTGVTVDQLGGPRPGSGTTWTIGARQVSFSPPPTPTPTPVYPPSAPREVTAEPGDASATVSWQAPASSGSFPVTNYLVVAEPGGATCLVAAPETSCEISGLRNGQSYSFTVQALNGAGWGARSVPSDPVTPQPACARVSVRLDQGTRVAAGRSDRIRTGGSTTCIPEGSRLTPWIRYSDQAQFSMGRATITVASDGSFNWTRLIRRDRGLTAYVSYVDVESNQVVWARVR